MKVQCLANQKYSPQIITRRNFGIPSIALKRRLSYGRRRRKFTGKELDAETGLYYYGARYLDPKTSRWLSGDPALGDYFPSAPVNDEAKKRNQNLPGQGGVFNYVNLHAYHYAGNNPVKYVDPDGRLQRDSEGKLIFTPAGEPEEQVHESGEKSLFQFGWLYTDDGTKIQAFENKDKEKPIFDTDCHGFTFADGKYWINNNQAESILIGDGYKKINENECEVGDVVLYKSISGDPEVVHSTRVVDVEREQGKVTNVVVEGLGGIEIKPHRDNVKDAWPNGPTTIYYYRKAETE